MLVIKLVNDEGGIVRFINEINNFQTQNQKNNRGRTQ